MEDRVPGGRQRSVTSDDMNGDEEEETAYNSARLSQQHRHVSQSLPKFSTDTRRYDSLPDDSHRSQTLDRRKKSRSPSFKASLGNFMHKMVRQVSSMSLSTSSPKSIKRRSHSVGPGDRKKRADALRAQNSFDLDRPSNTTSNSLSNRHRIPGIIGIRNHGNTCFMNAVLQCLCHTALLAEYFVCDQYKQDIKRNNKINAKRFGTKGELTEQLAMLLKSLWSGQYAPEISCDFKAVVGKYGSQYRGFAQHDAQEFLMWLLDKVHEDLNIATKKKYRANKSSHGRSDETVAAEALANHMRCNNSFVYDLFQALYRSSLTCPNCRRQSNTFDPFLSVSLPIPQKTKRPVYVTVVYLDAQPKQVRIGLLLNQNDTVRELRQTLANDTKIPHSQLILTEVYYDGFHRTFHDNQALSDLHETDNIYAIETPAPLEDHGPNNQYLAARYLLIILLNKQGMGSQGRRFGCPIVVQLPRDTTFSDMQKDILTNMTSMLRDGIIAQKMGILFKLRVIDGLPEKCYLPHEVEHPLYMPTVDRALTAHPGGSGPAHLKLIVEWDQQTKQCMVAHCEDVVEEHASVQQVRLAHQQPVLGTLDECFRLYTQEEKLGGDDAWHCPNCRKRQQGTIKSLSLWSLPDILVIHLKRFKQIGLRRTKLNTLITFPVRGLDMSQHATKRNHGTQHTTAWSPWRRTKHQDLGPEDYVYDLYAVCNHYGNMQGGHYTAFCRNPADDKWYVYDDSQVKHTSEDQIVTRAAYLLFYQRRSIHHAALKHSDWIYNIGQIEYRPRSSKSQEDLLEEDAASNYDNDDLTFSRGVEVYATMRSPNKGHPSPGVASSPGHSGMASSQSSGGLIEAGQWEGSPQHTSSAPSTDTPSHTSKGSTPTGTLSRQGTPSSNRGGTPTGTLTRNGTQQGTPTGAASSCPAAVSGVATMPGIYRGTISPSSSASIAARRTQSLGRSNSTTSPPGRPSAVSGSQPGTPTSGTPRPTMTRSSSMNTPPSTAGWQYHNTICMKESCV